MLTLRICHLYPDLLNLYGDRGNVLTLSKRCEWRGIGSSITPISIGDPFNSEDYDLVFIGGGQDYEQEILQPDLLGQKAQELKNYISGDGVVLAICGGYQLLGNYYKAQNGKEIRFLEALDLWTVAGETRMIGNIAFKSSLLPSEDSQNIIVGFENHSGKTYLGPGVQPMGEVVKGYGNNGETPFEGAVYQNTFCTYSHGSLLPKNPALSDFLIDRALRKKYSDFSGLTLLDDQAEKLAHDTVLNRIVHS
ncbi:MAG TPA: glutamine amidotransferase [Clostridia bacterium]|nr:glutamine amidotransferase [Clostridia bacterium]